MNSRTLCVTIFSPRRKPRAADQAATQLWRAADPIAAALWQAEFRRHHPLIERIIGQTERCVLQYCHKLNLTAGRRGLILASASPILHGRGKNRNPEPPTVGPSRRVKSGPAKGASGAAAWRSRHFTGAL
jgi:hypothetical protein